VDDHPEPLKELRRLLVLQRAYNHMNAGDAAMERKNHARALEEYGAAAGLAPGNLEIVYWYAIALVNMGRIEEAMPLFRKVFARDKNWVTLTPRLAETGLIPKDNGLIERICGVADH
jgi:tetratricopeptide (TPR) repeat protein